MFFISDAYAQAAGAAGPDPGQQMMLQILPIVVIVILGYFLLIRPNSQRMKAQQAMLAGIRKGDTIVTNGGVIGKVKSVADDELRIEIAPNVDVRLERNAVAVVRNRTEPAPANDTKPPKSD
jgi:preprotein translocase subunit YajC